MAVPLLSHRTDEARPGAVVLLSGGLDSATVAAMATQIGFEVNSLSFDYGQRHRVELEAAERVAGSLRTVSHRVVRIDMGDFGGSVLTDLVSPVPKDEEPTRGGIPPTYVPARNTVFLSIALGLAESIGVYDIFYGANAIDYSGYPDCRPAFVEAFERLANVAVAEAVEKRGTYRIHAPLMAMTKADIVRKAIELGVDVGLTHSCYDPIDGIACGRCDSCQLRQRGFREAGYQDPIRYYSTVGG